MVARRLNRLPRVSRESLIRIRTAMFPLSGVTSTVFTGRRERP